MLELDACVGGCEVPVGLSVPDISVAFPGGDFVDEALSIGDAAIKALGRQDAEFGLRQIEPAAVLWGVVPLEAFDQPPGLGGGKGFIE